MRSFIDQCHNQKEEKVLFPALRHCKDPVKSSQIQELVSENKLGSFYMVLLGKLCSSMMHGDPEAKQKFVKVSRKYIDLEARHIRKEAEFVVPMTQQRLSEEEKSHVEHDFDDYEDELFGGEGLHTKFHEAMGSAINHLNEVYIGSGSHN